MKKYESICIFTPSATEAEVEKLMEKFTAVVTSRGGTMGKMDRQGLKRLAVPIKHQTEGWHVLCDFESGPETIAELTRAHRMSDQVLRSLVSIKLPEPPPGVPVPPAVEAVPAAS